MSGSVAQGNHARALAPRLAGVVIARDAADSIAGCVESLSFTDEVIVVDGGSADDTAGIARRAGARVVHNPWPGFAEQRRFALRQTSAPWVFACDTDERASRDLAAAIRGAIDAPGGVSGYRVRRRNQFLGDWIDVGPWARDFQLRLFMRAAVRVTDASVHEGYAVDGRVETLDAPLHHYTHPSLFESVRRMNVYTALEARDRVNRRRVRALDPVLLPAGVFFNYYVAKGCWHAGVRGFLLAATTAMYRGVLYMKIALLQRRVGGGNASA